LIAAPVVQIVDPHAADQHRQTRQSLYSTGLDLSNII
jgi:hypothetical protein